MAHLEHARACGRWSSGKKYEESGTHPHGTFSLRGEDELVHRYNWEQDLSPHRVGVLSSVELGEGSRGNEGWRASFQTRGTSWLKPGAEKGKTNLGEESGKWWRYLREATIPIFSATVWAALLERGAEGVKSICEIQTRGVYSHFGSWFQGIPLFTRELRGGMWKHPC